MSSSANPYDETIDVLTENMRNLKETCLKITDTNFDRNKLQPFGPFVHVVCAVIQVYSQDPKKNSDLLDTAAGWPLRHSLLNDLWNIGFLRYHQLSLDLKSLDWIDYSLVSLQQHCPNLILTWIFMQGLVYRLKLPLVEKEMQADLIKKAEANFLWVAGQLPNNAAAWTQLAFLSKDSSYKLAYCYKALSSPISSPHWNPVEVVTDMLESNEVAPGLKLHAAVICGHKLEVSTSEKAKDLYLLSCDISCSEKKQP